ncbi:hypothetical protein BGZ96_008527 [Linnemannia gamsii]|uniref:Uncharacterized protein n=1 Tax=Linnemannia gamsii TaxID=64522 RepID=A0ABQ7JY64_9FUNG|nr:hypothetical protein BGZ96_008527 [Linnemannia gamsii]
MGEGGMRKACFLDSADFSPLVRRWSWTSEYKEEGEEEERGGEEEEIVAVVDLSHCETLEVLWIEDLDRNGQPHRLRSWKNSVKDLFAISEFGGDDNREDDETEDMVPFPRDQGLILPGRLKSLTMVGLSANKFNFGWLRATPKLETLSIHGMRFRRFDDAQFLPLPATTLWDPDRVFLPQLKYISIHHAPAQQFRFEVLKHCPLLDFLDIRDLCPESIREALVYPDGEHKATLASGSDGCGSGCGGCGSGRGRRGRCGSGAGGNESDFATKISTCRFEFLFRQQNHTRHIQRKGTIRASREEDLANGVFTGAEMVKLLEWYFPRLTRLHLEGIPAKLAIAITSGPPDPRKQQPPPSQNQHQRLNELLEITPSAAFTAAESEATTDDATTRRPAELPWLKSVLLTREEVTVQEVLEYNLVPFMNDGDEGGDVNEPLLRDIMVEQLGMKKHAVQYIFGTKTWQRIVS